MPFTDILHLGLYGLIYLIWFLIPRNILPPVSAALAEAECLLDHTESTGVTLQPNNYRYILELYSTELLQMRVESHCASGILQQLQVALRRSLTCRLYTFSSRVKAIKIKIKLAIDEHRIKSLTATLPTSAETVAMNNVAQPPPLPPDAAP